MTLLAQVGAAIVGFFSDGWRWLADQGPLIQGLFGGAGVTLLWEGLLKPRRELRSLARVLADEIEHDGQQGFRVMLYLAATKKERPGDLVFSTAVFDAVAARIGELGDVCAAVVLFYQRVAAIRLMPEQYDEDLARLRQIKLSTPTRFETREGPGHTYAIKAIERDLDLTLVAMRDSCKSLGEQARVLVAALRRLSTPWWRRRTPAAADPFDLAALRKEVAALVDRQRARVAEFGGTWPTT
ncbi:MAG: hypothetical protein AB7R55_12960 [Gemmatimonadales bacterium]